MPWGRREPVAAGGSLSRCICFGDSCVLYLPDNPKIAECPGVRMWMSAHFYFVFGAACSVPFIVCFFRRVKKKSKVKFR